MLNVIYAECHLDLMPFMLSVRIKLIMLNVIMLNVIMLNVIMLNVIMLNVIMLKVVAPFQLQLLPSIALLLLKGKCLTPVASTISLLRS